MLYKNNVYFFVNMIFFFWEFFKFKEKINYFFEEYVMIRLLFII